MVKGPCRGRLCDFWARVKIRKMPEESLVQELRASIVSCREEIGLERIEALQYFWAEFGVRNMDRLCQEEPELCKKIKRVEQLA